MPQEITGHYVFINGTRTYYDECGQGTPLFCIHSGVGSSAVYRHFLPIMADNGFRVIAPDLPGHGKSYPVRGEPIRQEHEFAEFVWKLIQAISSGEKPVVIGMANGGAVVLDLACYHSADIRAVMAGPAYIPAFGNLREQEDPHAFPGWERFVDRGTTMALYYPCPKERVDELKWIHHTTAQEIGVGDLQCWPAHDVRDKLKDIKCPVLAFRGEADFYIPEELLDQTVAGIPNRLGEKLVVKKAGHYPMFEQPEYVAKVLMDFLKRKKTI
jgi:pimeloyl-ACP methyl ester carboxylesterase